MALSRFVPRLSTPPCLPAPSAHIASALQDTRPPLPCCGREHMPSPALQPASKHPRCCTSSTTPESLLHLTLPLIQLHASSSPNRRLAFLPALLPFLFTLLPQSHPHVLTEYFPVCHPGACSGLNVTLLQLCSAGEPVCPHTCQQCPGWQGQAEVLWAIVLFSSLCSPLLVYLFLPFFRPPAGRGVHAPGGGWCKGVLSCSFARIRGVCGMHCGGVWLEGHERPAT